jgi:hypothetical protein
MPYKIHVEKMDPRTGALMPEGEPLEIVETKDDANMALQDLVRRGITNGYAVGYDRDSGERVDARGS